MRVIDALAVHKDDEGEMEVEHLWNLTATRRRSRQQGRRPDRPRHRGEEGVEAGAAAGAEAAEAGVHAFSDEDARDVLEEIPNTPRRR